MHGLGPPVRAVALARRSFAKVARQRRPTSGLSTFAFRLSTFFPVSSQFGRRGSEYATMAAIRY